ncbi:CoA pyrophosphatase [Limibaculum sp. M0105]|uniref:CoA pyrophosphatase n=1 Tax=Thermohalobaculum xanthum TaxID=2753746 RepID=A0A8J7M737_9RHOB|nr:CoA pyrophosphatase [Thermohalobaculum xanthum]MBK0398754.1 CoA pyrophosphatase [Thermohalobaculum xanthum]
MQTARFPHDTALRERLAANLGRHRGQDCDDPTLRRAAVSVVLVPGKAAGSTLLLTRRAPRLRAHSGQYALPGGKLDPDESPRDAALRELAEELGVAAAPGDILGRLDDLPTRAGYVIRPFVIWLAAAPVLRPAPDEIAAVHRVPLEDLFAGRGRGGNRDIAAGSEDEAGVFSLFIPALGHDLFAPTAAILDHFREVALLGRSSPVVRFGEPAFARR